MSIFAKVMVMLVLMVGLISFVYSYKGKVEQKEIELRQLEAVIQKKTNQLSVLRAEWSHLTQAELLRQRNEAELGLSRNRISQYYSVEAIPQIFPPRGDRQTPTTHPVYRVTP
ncbi:MAG: hypothetical protein ORO03_05670 [Alphaproteobacteria bacterium]|nr:hypothetical protein [Alphaproteobacteria bacterium]